MIALAFDLGASGGKAVAGRFDGRRLHLHEIHRFRNDPVRLSGHLHWARVATHFVNVYIIAT